MKSWLYQYTENRDKEDKVRKTAASLATMLKARQPPPPPPPPPPQQTEWTDQLKEIPMNMGAQGQIIYGATKKKKTFGEMVTGAIAKPFEETGELVSKGVAKLPGGKNPVVQIIAQLPTSLAAGLLNPPRLSAENMPTDPINAGLIMAGMNPEPFFALEAAQQIRLANAIGLPTKLGRQLTREELATAKTNYFKNLKLGAAPQIGLKEPGIVTRAMTSEGFDATIGEINSEIKNIEANIGARGQKGLAAKAAYKAKELPKGQRTFKAMRQRLGELKANKFMFETAQGSESPELALKSITNEMDMAGLELQARDAPFHAGQKNYFPDVTTDELLTYRETLDTQKGNVVTAWEAKATATTPIAAQTGLPGMGKEAAQANMLAEWQGAKGMKQEPLIKPPIAQPLPGQAALPEEAAAKIPEVKPAGKVSIPIMITKKMETNLKGLGYSQEAIDKMTPQVANDILAKGVKPAAPAAKVEGVAKVKPEVTRPLTEAGKGVPPVKPPRKPLWAGIEEPPKPPAETGAGLPPELPSGRKPGGIGQMKPVERAKTDYERLVEAVTPAKKPIKDAIKDARDKILADWYDRNYALKELGESRKLAQLVPGATAAGENVIRTSVRPIYSNLGKDVKYLEQYMVLMRSQDVLARNPQAFLPGGIRGWGGVVTALKDLETQLGTRRMAALKEVAAKLWSANDELNLKYLLDNGLINKETYTAIKSAHPHYIPFQRADFVDDIARTLSKPEASVGQIGIKRMELAGSERALSDPLAAFESNFIKTRQVVARNEAAKAIVEDLVQLQKTTGDDLVKFIEPKAEIAKIERVTGQVVPKTSKAEHSALRDMVSYFKDGTKYTVEIPAKYAKVAKGLEWEPNNILVNILRAVGRPLAKGATTYNPAFLIINPMRDALSAWFREGLVPLSPAYFKGWWAVLRPGETYTQAAEAKILLSGLVDTMRTTEAMSRVGKLGSLTVKSPKDVALFIPRLIEWANVRAEQSTRVATWLKLRGKGIGELDAAVRARDVTVDFAKSGNAMKVVNQVIPFSNAGMQGAANIIRTWKNTPQLALARSSPFAAASILTWVNNQRFETGKDIPWYEYLYYWPIQIGEGTAKDGTKFPITIKIPKGPVAAPITAPIEIALGTSQRQKDYSIVEMIWQSAWDMTQQLTPVQPEVAGILPPILKTGVSLQTGKSLFTGLPIIPQREEQRLPEQQWGPETSKFAIMIGKALNVSPRKIDFAIRDYTAGTGELTNWLLGLGLEALGYSPEAYGEALAETPSPTLIEEFGQAPVTRRFVGTKGTQEEMLGWDEFNKAVEETKRSFSQLPDINRLGITFSAVGDEIDKVPLTMKERTAYQKVAWLLIEEMLGVLVSNTSYQQVDDNIKKKAIQKAVNSAREQAKALILQRIGEQQIQSRLLETAGKK